MNSPLGMVIGGALIASAIAGPLLLPHYQIAAGADTSGNPMVWRIETRSGEIQACRFYPQAAGTPTSATPPPRSTIDDDPFAKIMSDPKSYERTSKLTLRCEQEVAISSGR
jgi:hypothetical protein